MGIPRAAKLGRRGDPEFCSLAAGSSGSQRSSGCCSQSAREGAAGGPEQGYRPAAAAEVRPPRCPLDSDLPPGEEWAQGGPSRCAPPPSGPESAWRAGARALCIKPSSRAKVEEVGLPPGWEAEGSPAPVVFLEREWVAGKGAGCALPPWARRSRERVQSGNQPRRRPQPQHPSWGLRRVELLCRSVLRTCQRHLVP